MKTCSTKRKAFTLIELLIVIAIIGILFIVLVSKVDFATDKAKATGVQTDFRSYQMAFETVAKENAGFNTFGWDTGDANQDGIRNSYDEGDNGNGGGIAKNGIQDGAEVFTGRKVYDETFTKAYSLKKNGTGNYDRDALNRLETAINANLDPKLHITIKDDGEIVMANGAQDPWNKEYHGYYITNAENDKKDRGAIVMYSDGANNEFGSKHTIANGIISISIPNNNKYGKDDYGMAVIYTYVNGYGEVKNITTGFSNNQSFLAGGNANSGGIDDNVVTPQEPDVTDLLDAGLYETGAIELAKAGDIETAQEMLTTPWSELSSTNIVGVIDGKFKMKVTDVIGDLILPNDGSITTIDSQACYNCDNLTSIMIPDSVTSIDDHAFRDCTGLTSVTIGNSVTSIGAYAFWNCSSLTSITIPDSVTSIGSSAFEDCTGLTSVTIGNSVTSIGANAFWNCSSLTSVTIPDSVTSIGFNAFHDCSSLTSVIIPDSVTSIGWSAFEDTGYYKNESNWENGVLYIGKYLIEAKTDITGAYTVKSGTNVIADWAFDSCSKLTSITIPDSVTSIGSSAFRSCSSITSITIPDSVTSMGDRAFYECTGLNSVTIGDSVTSIDSAAFSGCTGLTSITIPDSVTSIGDQAFSYCDNLTSVTIPDSVTSIDMYAFNKCTSLTSVTIGNSVTSIGSGAFSGCTGLTSIIVDENNLSYKSIDGNLYSKDGKTLIQYAKGKPDTSFIIPDGVTSIGDDAVINCSSLTSITIPDSVTSIGWGAFSGCTNLTSITIPDSVMSIGKGAFYGCTGLNSVTIGDSVTSIGIEAFSGCTGLTSVTIPNSVTSMGDYAFSGCTGLTSVMIGNSVTSIGYQPFSGCTGLTSIIVDENNLSYKSIDGNLYSKDGKTLIQYAKGKPDTSFIIPDSVTSIGSSAFEDCTGLTSIIIPDSVTSIGSFAFSYCTNLTSITIPDSVMSIDMYAFYDTGLTDIYINKPENSIEGASWGAYNATVHWNSTGPKN